MGWGEHTVICTYRVRAGSEDEFMAVLKRHWPTLRKEGLVTDTEPLYFEATPDGSEHSEQVPTFIEIFAWAGPDAARLAHDLPSVMAVWERMGALTEARGGKPPVEFPHFRGFELAPA